MNFLKSLTAALAALALALGALSCSVGSGESLTVTENYSCSPDLLDFVVPTLHYVNEAGDSVNITLSKDDFKMVDLGMRSVTLNDKGHIAIDVMKFTANQYTFSKRYDGWEANDTITISYAPAPDAPAIEDGKEYTFYHGVFSSTAEACQKGKSAKDQEKKNPVNVDILMGDDAKNYIDRLLISEISVIVDVRAESVKR